MTITYRDLFHKVAQLRKAFKVPLDIHHLSMHKGIKKADEAFWDFKCEHNLDFPFRYSELHRILNVIHRKQFCVTISTDAETIENYNLLSILVNRGLVYRSCAINGRNTIISNFMCDKSNTALRTITYLVNLHKKGKISNVELLLLQDWICGVPLTTVLLYAQVSEDFQNQYKMDPFVLLSRCASILKKRSENFLYAKFSKDIKENYYGCHKKILHNAKARSSKITG